MCKHPLYDESTLFIFDRTTEFDDLPERRIEEMRKPPETLNTSGRS